METVTRNIGLSLGADLCWPASYEAILAKLDLKLPVNGKNVTFKVERVTVEPYDLEYKPKYDLVLDRLTHWFFTSREWMKKITLMDGVYAFNNPWSIQANEKHTSYAAMLKLGYPIPKTWMIPPKDYKDEGDTKITIRRYNKMFDLAKVGDAVGYPAFLKPYDGGGWVGVTMVKNAADLHKAYDASGTRVQHLQAGVKDWDLFIRVIGIGPQFHVVKYDPNAPLHARYTTEIDFLTPAEVEHAKKIGRTINAFFGWDFNSCEMLRSNGVFYPIDFANACPDSQVTSLHFHFPWLVKSLLKWSIYCAATKRKMKLTLNWDAYLDANDESLSFEERLDRYDALARAHFDEAGFEAFCKEHLGDLDAVAWEFFGTPEFKEIVRAKVAALFPAHEINTFTDHFFAQVQKWRALDGAKEGRA